MNNNIFIFSIFQKYIHPGWSVYKILEFIYFIYLNPEFFIEWFIFVWHWKVFEIDGTYVLPIFIYYCTVWKFSWGIYNEVGTLCWMHIITKAISLNETVINLDYCHNKTLIYCSPIYRVPWFSGPQFYPLKTSFM